MGDDEEATFRTLTAHRKIIDGLIEFHHGRFVGSAGDSVLAEFASVVNAVECTREIQSTLKAENASLPPPRAASVFLAPSENRLENRPLTRSSNQQCARATALS